MAHYPRAVTDPTSITYAATITPDAAQGTLFRCTATGNLTLNDPTSGVDGQWLRVEVTASGAARTVTLTNSGTKFTIASGSKAAFDFTYDGTNWWIEALVA